MSASLVHASVGCCLSAKVFCLEVVMYLYCFTNVDGEEKCIRSRDLLSAVREYIQWDTTPIEKVYATDPESDERIDLEQKTIDMMNKELQHIN